MVIYGVQFCLVLWLIIQSGCNAGKKMGPRFGSGKWNGVPPRMDYQGQRCGIPNLPRGQPVDPRLIAGTWYDYGEYSSSPIPTVETKGGETIEVIVEKTLFPVTLEPAVLIKRSEFRNERDAASQTDNCINRFNVGYLGYDGQWEELNFTPASDGLKTEFDRTTERIAYTDYNFIYIGVQCTQPSFDDEICKDAYIYIVTRQDPKLFSQRDQYYIRNVVNDKLAKYCIRFEDFVQFSQEETTCGLADPPACYTAAVSGFTDAAISLSPYKRRDGYRY